VKRSLVAMIIPFGLQNCYSETSKYYDENFNSDLSLLTFANQTIEIKS
jgi:hypothetical protein